MLDVHQFVDPRAINKKGFTTGFYMCVSSFCVPCLSASEVVLEQNPNGESIFGPYKCQQEVNFFYRSGAFDKRA